MKIEDRKRQSCTKYDGKHTIVHMRAIKTNDGDGEGDSQTCDQ